MIKKLLFSTLLCTVIVSGFSQNVNIPDANFKAYLVGNSSINTNSDAEIQVSEASAYTETIWVRNENISDLTGIEAFTQITQLECSRNQLTTLDVSNNTQLTYLNCGDNQLNSIDVSILTNLTDFRISLSSDITSIDLSNNTLLERFNAQLVGLTEIDLSNNLLLNHLEFVSEATELDLTNNSMLQILLIGGNNITSLDLRNGNNTIITDFEILSTLGGFNAINLDCIFVDDKNYSINNWSNPYPTSTFFVETEAECNTLGISEPETLEVNIYPNPFTSELVIDGLNQFFSVKIYDLQGKLLITSYQKSINTNVLANGMYILSIDTGSGRISKKILKQ